MGQWDYKVEQARLRRAVARRGFVLQPSRALGADHPERGRYRVVPAGETSRAPYTLTHDDVQRWLDSGRRTPPQRGRYVLPDAVHVSGTQRPPGAPEHQVLSGVAGETRDVMAEILDLWTTPDDVMLDVTYGNGAMWPKGRRPAITHDLALDGVDCRALPEAENSVDVVVFDPPYRPRNGGDGAAYQRTYRLHESAPESIDDVLALYRDGLTEARRVLRSEARVVVKCADLTISGKLRLVHVDVLVLLDSCGFDLADHFVVVNNARVPSRGAQQRARRSHSHLLVGTRR